MIRNIINLTKVFLISSFSRGGNRKKKNNIGKIALYAVLFIYLAGVFGYLSYEVLSGLIAVKQEEAFIGLILMAIITLVLFSFSFSLISSSKALSASSTERVPNRSCRFLSSHLRCFAPS